MQTSLELGGVSFSRITTYAGLKIIILYFQLSVLYKLSNGKVT